MVAPAVMALTPIQWAALITNGASLIKQASDVTTGIATFLTELQAGKKNGTKKESTAEYLARLAGDMEILAANQQQLAQVLTEASEQQQAIVKAVALNRRLFIGAITLGGLNLALLSLLLLLR